MLRLLRIWEREGSCLTTPICLQAQAGENVQTSSAEHFCVTKATVGKLGSLCARPEQMVVAGDEKAVVVRT
jgi:hypothetical protein